jgi:hypothetical protein
LREKELSQCFFIALLRRVLRWIMLGQGEWRRIIEGYAPSLVPSEIWLILPRFIGLTEIPRFTISGGPLMRVNRNRLYLSRDLEKLTTPTRQCT